MRMRFLPDEPIEDGLQDLLGFRDFVELIQSSIYNTEAPFVYGVLGDWGSGKTSILKLLKRRLEQDLENNAQAFVPVWFNAWQYENEANIVYPLLYAIKHDYGERIGPLDEAKEFGKRFFQVVATSALAVTDMGLRVATKYLTGEALKLKDLSEHLAAVQEHPGELERLLGGWADQVANLHKAFEILLDTYATELAALHPEFVREDIRFVILVDDLDRCLPDTTIAVLESIKNYLAVPNCVFVLGLNPGIIYQGIRIKYRGLEVDGRAYLEKILNYSFYIPEPALARIAEFAADQLEALVLDDAERERYGWLFKGFGQALQDCHFTNPRKIKRILNRYLLFLSKYEERFKAYNANIVRLIVLAEYFPRVFQLFLEHPTAVQTITARLGKVGELDFDIEGFEKEYGVAIAADYPQLSRMGKLFDLSLHPDAAEHSLSKQAEAVFSIARLF
jgi:hypothetical protein